MRLGELQPVGNMFEWHFTFLGAKDSPFEGGLYHGSITLPPDYPQSGPSVRLLTPNQRFKARKGQSKEANRIENSRPNKGALVSLYPSDIRNAFTTGNSEPVLRVSVSGFTSVNSERLGRVRKTPVTLRCLRTVYGFPK